MYRCESWTIKRAECQKIDAFEPWCWRILLRVPWTARRSKQSIVKEISPGYSLEGLMLKLKLLYFGRLMWRANSLEKTLMLGEIESKRRRGRQRRRCWMPSSAQWRWIWANWETMENRGAWRAAVHGVAKNWKWLSNWMTKSEVCVTRCWLSLASLVAQTVKNLSVKWEPPVRSLGWEDPLGKGMATHSSILAWRIP